MWPRALWPMLMKNRDWRIYAQLAQVLIRKARDLYREEELDFQLQDTVYALDATTIDLCLNLLPWAHFRKFKGAVKLHTQIDLCGAIPTFLEGNHSGSIVHDVNVLDRLIIEPEQSLLRDGSWLYRFCPALSFFEKLRGLTTRCSCHSGKEKPNVCPSRSSLPVEKASATSRRSVQVIHLRGPFYPFKELS